MRNRLTSRYVGVLFGLTLFLIAGDECQVIAREKRTIIDTIKKPGKKRSSANTSRKSKATKPNAASAKKDVQSVSVPMFGKRYARVALKDRSLRGAVYYLASGHGGPDPGAIGYYGKQQLAEDEYAYDVTIRLARALMEHGAAVYMMVRDPNDGIRDDKILKVDHDEVAYGDQKIPLDQNKRLRQCTDAVNRLHSKLKAKYQRLITIHVDSRSQGEKIDVFFYHHENSKPGKRLAKLIHKSFKSGYKRSQPGRSYSGTVSDRSELYVVKNSNPPTVFIELGNIQNDKDQRRFLIADNRQALANWICAGLQTDLKRAQ
ncbi:N-acetylmuramoyl-L-alanine amidase family protein [Spirosoma flavus]